MPTKNCEDHFGVKSVMICTNGKINVYTPVTHWGDLFGHNFCLNKRIKKIFSTWKK